MARDLDRAQQELAIVIAKARKDDELRERLAANQRRMH
jgi:hypothetical protein